MTLGRSLISQLSYLFQQRKIKIWRDSPMIDLVEYKGSNAGVIGARIQQGSEVCIVNATRGVLLCAGGFAKNENIRRAWSKT